MLLFYNFPFILLLFYILSFFSLSFSVLFVEEVLRWRNILLKRICRKVSCNLSLDYCYFYCKYLKFIEFIWTRLSNKSHRVGRLLLSTWNFKRGIVGGLARVWSFVAVWPAVALRSRAVEPMTLCSSVDLRLRCCPPHIALYHASPIGVASADEEVLWRGDSVV